MSISTESQVSVSVLSGTEEEVHIAPGELVNLDGVELRVEYVFEPYDYFGPTKSGRVMARLYVELSRLDQIKFHSEWGLVDELSLKAVAIDKWIVTEGDNELFTASNWSGLKWARKTWKRSLAEKAYREQLDVSRRELIRLRGLGRPTDGLEHLIAEATTNLRHYSLLLASGSDAAAVATQLRSIENEITRITDGGTKLLIDDLLDGKIDHKDVAHNQWVIDQVKMWSIRTGGFIEMLTPSDLQKFYLERAWLVTRVDELQRLSLRLNLNNYVLMDMLDELECAPATIVIQGRKVDVSYDLYEVGGELVPVGVISISRAIYAPNAAAYGKKSGFPELPHGIRLFIHVTVDGKEVAKGFDDDVLAKKLTAYRKGAKRGEIRRKTAGLAFDTIGNEIKETALPPWYKGKPPRF